MAAIDCYTTRATTLLSVLLSGRGRKPRGTAEYTTLPEPPQPT